MPAAISTPILSPHEVGERCHGEAVTERGKAPPKSRSRRTPGTTERARSLRWIENDAEGLLWFELKGRKLGGHHFTRQHPTGPYFADFCCRKTKLVVEVDGWQHAGSIHDRRDEFMLGRLVRSPFLERSRPQASNISLQNHPRLDRCRLSKKVEAVDLRFVYAKRTQ